MIDKGAEATIKLAGRARVIQGDPTDRYFQNVRTAAANLAPLKAWVNANLPKDAVVIDAGGNIGLTALLMATLLPRGHVHVFEALPANADHLRQNILRNGISNCTVNAVALGAEHGTVVMHGTGSASHVAVEAGFTRVLARGVIPMVTLDDYARDAGLERLNEVLSLRW